VNRGTPPGDAPPRSRKRAWAIAFGVTAGVVLLSLVPLILSDGDDDGEIRRDADRARRDEMRTACAARLRVLADELRRYRDEMGNGRNLPATLSALRVSGYWQGDLRALGCPACDDARTGGALGGYALVGGGAEAAIAAKFPPDEWILVCDSVTHGHVVHIINGNLDVLAVPAKWARTQLAAQADASP
jgi:hypothetical protein